MSKFVKRYCIKDLRTNLYWTGRSYEDRGWTMDYKYAKHFKGELDLLTEINTTEDDGGKHEDFDDIDYLEIVSILVK